MNKVLDFSLQGKKKVNMKMPAVKTSTAVGVRLICKYEKRRSAVNAMADSSRRSLNLSEIWTQSITNGQRIFNFLFFGMIRHTWLASQLDTKISLFSGQMVYKLWRIVQLVRCCFQLKSNNPRCPTFQKPLFVDFHQFIFIFNPPPGDQSCQFLL